MLADIHGNADALRATLADARSQGAEQLIVNGDVVNRGPDSVEVLETLLARDDVSFVLGNHDDLLRLWQARSDKLPPDWYADPFWGATDWSAESLRSAGLLGALRDWPLTQVLSEPGLPDVLIAHGTADDYREGLSERLPPSRVEAVARGHTVVVGSHIHRPVIHRAGDVLLANTGAVGVSADGDPRAAHLLLTADEGSGGGEWQAETVRVPYDRAGALRRFSESGMLDSGLSAEIFKREVETARSLYTPYWLWTEQRGLTRDRRSWAEFEAHPVSPWD